MTALWELETYKKWTSFIWLHNNSLWQLRFIYSWGFQLKNSRCL